MAFSNNWDESSPAGSAAAATLDTIIQNLKTDVRERLDPVLTNFANDTDDPKRLVFTSGLKADRTDSADANVSALVLGEIFYATDTEELFIWDGSAWILIGVGGGSTSTAVVLSDTISNRPAASSVEDSTLFWATDEDKLYVEEADNWIEVGGGTGGGGQVTTDQTTNVDDDLSAGNQQTATDAPPRILRGSLAGTTDIDGKVLLDLNEVSPGTWDANDVLQYATLAVSDDIDVQIVRVTGISGGTNEVEFTFYDQTGSALGSGVDVTANFIMPFSS